MKLIIKEYLASLKERGELDVVLPDLLSQLGLNVYSRPARGTRQDGVDVGAVGSLDGEAEKVYLFSIKPGDLTRRDWDGDSAQSLRPSLNEILDSYIPNRMPAEHRDKDIVICIAIGGDVQEQVRPLITGYTSQKSQENISFEEWNGDKLAALIQARFLREDLLPEQARSNFRKSLAMLDEPDVSYRHFALLIESLSNVDNLISAQRITAIRQMSICLWILYTWAREAGNMESAYRASELTLLHAWAIAKLFFEQSNKASRAAEAALISVFTAYNQICSEFLRTNVLPYAGTLHAVSVAVGGSNSLDVNLKLFDLLGRLGLDGLWAYWGGQRCLEGQEEARQKMNDQVSTYAEAIIELINNNPTLLMPTKDEQVIDISIALALLVIVKNGRDFIRNWLAEMLMRARFSYEAHGNYPCILQRYTELLEHPKSRDVEYRESATSASILYPVIGLWAALLGDERLFMGVASLKREVMNHCTFQFWYLDDSSEEHLYRNDDVHGAAMTRLALGGTAEEFLSQVFRECTQTRHFEQLTAVKCGWWPLIAVACRHYRLPLPLDFLQELRKSPAEQSANMSSSATLAEDL
jgi:hypothetical protein